MTTVTPATVLNYGALVVFFTVVIGLVAFWLTKVLPADRTYQRNLNQAVLEQVALSRQVIEISNKVISQNSVEMRENRVSHARIGERLEGVEDKLERHDKRSEDIHSDVTIIKTKVCG